MASGTLNMSSFFDSPLTGHVTRGMRSELVALTWAKHNFEVLYLHNGAR